MVTLDELTWLRGSRFEWVPTVRTEWIKNDARHPDGLQMKTQACRMLVHSESWFFIQIALFKAMFIKILIFMVCCLYTSNLTCRLGTRNILVISSAYWGWRHFPVVQMVLSQRQTQQLKNGAVHLMAGFKWCSSAEDVRQSCLLDILAFYKLFCAACKHEATGIYPAIGIQLRSPSALRQSSQCLHHKAVTSFSSTAVRQQQQCSFWFNI